MITLSLNRNIINKVASPNLPGWHNISTNTHELAEMIKNGYAISPGVIKDDADFAVKPKSSDIKEAQIIAVDIDNSEKIMIPETRKYRHVKSTGHKYMTFDKVTADPDTHDNLLLAYTSPSHTDAWHKFRLVFKLPHPVTHQEYHEIVTALIEKYNGDISCKNIDRMFFGNTNAQMVIPDNNMSEDFVNKVLKKNALGPKNMPKQVKKYSESKTIRMDAAAIRVLLQYIPTQQSYDDWMKVVSAVGNMTDFNTAVALIDGWSPDTGKGTEYKIKNRLKEPNESYLIATALKHGCPRELIFVTEKSKYEITETGEVVNKDTGEIGLPYENTDFNPDTLHELIPPDLVFWQEVPRIKTADPDNKSDWKLNILKHKVLNYLEWLGFAKYFHEDTQSMLIKIVDNVVEITTTEIIMDALKDNILKFPPKVTSHFDNLDLYETILASSKKLADETFLQQLNAVPDNFARDTKDSAYFFFKNAIVQVGHDGKEEAYQKIKYADFDKYVWRDQIIEHNIGTIYTDAKQKGQFQIFIEKVCSPSGEDRKKRKKDPKRFMSLVTGIGYMLHTYKNPALTKALVLCEERIGDKEQSNGRTGKGLTAKAMSKMRKLVKINGKHLDFKNSFFYAGIKHDTQICYFDDVMSNFDFERLFSDITDGITVNRKNEKPFDIPYSKSPKFMLSTNKVLSNDSDSHKARKIEIEYSDYFTADYQPADEFGNLFFEEGWSEDSPEWDKFFSFMMGSTAMFLLHGLRGYDSVNLNERKLRERLPEQFIEYIEDYLTALDDDGKIYKEKLYEDFTNKHKIFGHSGRRAVTQKQVTRWLADYLKIRKVPYEDKQSGKVKYIQIIKQNDYTKNDEF